MNDLDVARPAFAVLAAAAALGIALWLARRGTRHETAFLDLWEQALQSASLLERIVRLVPGLQALALALAAGGALFAASGPFLREPKPVARLYVLDRSATMSARGERGTRLDEARDWIRADAKQRAPDDRLGLAFADHALDLAVEPTLDRDELARALEGVTVEPAASDLSEALGALEGTPIPVVAVTDAAGSKGAQLAARTSLRVHVVGAPIGNAGIVGLEVDDRFPSRTAHVTARVRNASRAQEAMELAIARGAETIAKASVTIPRGEERDVALDVPRGKGGLFRVSLAPGDGFALDDDSTFLLREPASAPIALVSPAEAANAFLESAVRALAQEIDVPALIVPSARDAPPGAVILQDGGALDAAPTRAVLFGVTAPGVATALSPAVENRTVSVESAHRLVAGIRFDLLVARATVRLDDAGAAIVRGSAGTLIAADAGAGRRIVAVSFRLADSDLPVLDGALPRLVRRAFLWCTAGESEIVPCVPTGAIADAALRTLPEVGPRRLGPWTLPDGRRTSASLLDRDAADVTPGSAPAAAAWADAPRREVSLARPLVEAALALLAVALGLELLAAPRGRRRPFRFRIGRARSSVGGPLTSASLDG